MMDPRERRQSRATGTTVNVAVALIASVAILACAETAVTTMVKPTPTKGPSGQVVTVDDKDLNIMYTGDWIFLQGPDYNVYSDSTAHTTTMAGASFSYTFKGTGLTLIASEGVDYGRSTFYIDGSAATTINFNASSQHNQVSVPIATGLTFSTHTLQGVVVDGRLTVDALDINT